MHLFQDLVKNNYIARSSPLSNQVDFNLIRLRKEEISRVCVQFKDSNGTKCKIVLDVGWLKANQGEFYYPPVSFNSPFLKLSYWKKDECLIQEELPIQSWQLTLENISNNQINGWIAVKSIGFVIRPPQLFINGFNSPYKISIRSRKVFVENVLSSFNVKAYCINILVGRPLKPGSNISLELSYETLEREVFYSQSLPINSWQNILRSTYSEGRSIEKTTYNAITKDSGERICILIPIYNGVDETFQLIDSLRQYFSNKDISKVRFLLGLDNPNNKQMSKMVHSNFSQIKNIQIIENKKNLGFVGNCNNLYSHVNQNEDILLLNSDTICPNCDWISTLIDYKNKDASIGTVTPFSNQASIFSFPILNKLEQSLPLELSIDDVNRILPSKQAQTEIIEVPSCHGFCVLIVSSRLNLPYLFDTSFGAGYAEENDLSQRIFRQGLKNICCPEVYIYHLESVSFAERKISMLEKNLRLLKSKYPQYDEAVTEYSNSDPLRNTRLMAILNGLKLNFDRYNKAYFLHVCHDRGGGTHEFISKFIKSHPTVYHLLLTPIKEKCMVQLSILAPTKNGFQKNLLGYLYEAEIYEYIKKLGEDRLRQIIFHSLIDFGIGVYTSSFLRLAEVFPSILYIHDYHWLSPLQNLLVGNYNYYGSCLNNSIVDIEMIRKHDYKPCMSESAKIYSSISSNFVDAVDQCVAPSNAAAKIFEGHIRQKSVANLTVQYHDDTHLTPYVPRKSIENEPINIGVIGAVGPNKGSVLLEKICTTIHDNELNIQIIFIGFTCADEIFKQYKFVTIHGPYKNEDFPLIADKYRLNGTLFVSPWPETFSYTLSLAFENNLFPIVLDSGAQAERVRLSSQGMVLSSSKPDDICRAIINQFKV